MTEITSYMAYDGTIFTTLEDCKLYEKDRLNIFETTKFTTIDGLNFFNIDNLQRLQDFNFYLKSMDWKLRCNNFRNDLWIHCLVITFREPTFDRFGMSYPGNYKYTYDYKLLTLEDYKMKLISEISNYNKEICDINCKIKTKEELISNCNKILNLKD